MVNSSNTIPYRYLARYVLELRSGYARYSLSCKGYSGAGPLTYCKQHDA